MPLEELLVEADRLDRDDLLADDEALDPVDEQQRVAVRQGVEDLRDVVSARASRAVLAHALPRRLSGPGRGRRRGAPAARLLLLRGCTSICCTSWNSWTDWRCGCQPAGTLVETVGTSVLSWATISSVTSSASLA
jgi:hypothetical protein